MKDSETRDYVIQFLNDEEPEWALKDVFIDTTDENLILFSRHFEVVAAISKASIKFILQVKEDAD